MDYPKLLIVDDDEEICRQMRWALSQDYEVFLAHDRARALHVFKAQQPAVVTLDLGLPPHPRNALRCTIWSPNMPSIVRTVTPERTERSGHLQKWRSSLPVYFHPVERLFWSRTLPVLLRNARLIWFHIGGYP
jgi:hypothetical protein